jgi:hypothetical protein
MAPRESKDLDIDPWKELLSRLKRVALYANQRAGIDSPSVFERLALETFTGELQRFRTRDLEEWPTELEPEILGE